MKITDTPSIERLKELLAKATEPRPAPLPEQDSRVGEAGAAQQDDRNYRLWRERIEAARAEIVNDLPHLIAALETLTPSAGEVERASRVLVDKLEAIHEDPAFKSVWVTNQMHTGPYRGPTYERELAALKAALASPPPQRQWSPHLDYSGEPMGLGEFRDPLEQPDIEGRAREIADRICRDVAELPDRTSPDDWPEAMLATGNELHLLVTEAILAALAFPTTEIRREALGEASAAVEAERERLRATVRDNLLDNFDRGQLNGCEQALKVISSLISNGGQ